MSFPDLYYSNRHEHCECKGGLGMREHILQLRISLSHFPEFSRKDTGAFTKKFRKTTGLCVSNALRHLPNGNVCVGQERFRLTHAPLLDIISKGTAMVFLKCGLKLPHTHTGYLYNLFQRDVLHTMVIDI